MLRWCQKCRSRHGWCCRLRIKTTSPPSSSDALMPILRRSVKFCGTSVNLFTPHTGSFSLWFSHTRSCLSSSVSTSFCRRQESLKRPRSESQVATEAQNDARVMLVRSVIIVCSYVLCTGIPQTTPSRNRRFLK